jgi:hypothetical protein
MEHTGSGSSSGVASRRTQSSSLRSHFDFTLVPLRLHCGFSSAGIRRHSMQWTEDIQRLIVSCTRGGQWPSIARVSLSFSKAIEQAREERIVLQDPNELERDEIRHHLGCLSRLSLDVKIKREADLHQASSRSNWPGLPDRSQK